MVTVEKENKVLTCQNLFTPVLTDLKRELILESSSFFSLIQVINTAEKIIIIIIIKNHCLVTINVNNPSIVDKIFQTILIKYYG